MVSGRYFCVRINCCCPYRSAKKGNRLNIARSFANNQWNVRTKKILTYPPDRFPAIISYTNERASGGGGSASEWVLITKLKSQDLGSTCERCLLVYQSIFISPAPIPILQLLLISNYGVVNHHRLLHLRLSPHSCPLAPASLFISFLNFIFMHVQAPCPCGIKL